MKEIKNFSIVVVEDNVFFQQLIAKQLESINSTISFFTNGEDCIEELNNCKPDIIVLDNNLGGLMSGLDTLKIIRKADPEVNVILFSTELALNSEENFSLYGLFDYIEKNNTGFKILKERILEKLT